MRPQWIRLQRRCVYLAAGGITLGIFQGLSLVNFASLFTSLLAQLLSALVTLLFGGQVDTTGTGTL